MGASAGSSPRSPPIAERPLRQENQSASPHASPRQSSRSRAGSTLGLGATPPVSSPLVNADDSVRGGAKGVSLNEAIIAGRMQERGQAQQEQEQGQDQDQEELNEWAD